MYYYGQTPAGKRIHLGDFIISQTGRSEWVETFCGNEMDSWEAGERPPGSRVTEFCKNCFRAYAWQIMVDNVGAMARAASMVDRLDNLIDTAGSRTANELIEELREIVAAERAHYDEITVPPARVQPTQPAPVESPGVPVEPVEPVRERPPIFRRVGAQ